MEVEDVLIPGNPTGEVVRLTGLAHPANSTLAIARTTRSRVDVFGLSFNNTDKNGALGSLRLVLMTSPPAGALTPRPGGAPS